jgi:NADH-quinone oxidoreductase subunit I
MIRDEDVYTIDSPKMTALEASYLPEVFKGLGTTMKHILGTVSGNKRRYLKTIEYPEERRENMDIFEGGMWKGNYRGVHRLNRDEQGRVKCVACFMCATACPARCIHIEGEEAPWDDREKYPVKFDIDELRCIYCGMCEEACPVDAIELTPEYDIVGMTRQELIFDKQKLLRIYDETIEDKPM